MPASSAVATLIAPPRAKEISLHWYSDLQIRQDLPPLMRVLASYYRWRANPATGEAPGGRHWHTRMARLIRRLELKDTARVRLRHLLVEIDLLDARCLWVMDELLRPCTEANVLRRLLKPGDTFLDIGANHGSFALLVAAPTGRDGRVLAFEPQPRLARLMRRSFDLNAFFNATVYEYACADRNAEAEFHVPDVFSGVGSLYEGLSRSRTRRRRMKVSVRRLDDLLAGEELPGRVAMKIDVEGSELAVLRGAAAFVRARRPLILLEINPTSARAAGFSIGELFNFLSELGYRRLADPDTFPATTPIAGADRVRQRNVFVVPDPSPEANCWHL